MTSKIKVDNIHKVSDDSNIIKKCGSTITLGASGDSIALASGASQTGFGRTGTVDWDTTPKTATFSAVSGNGYFCNTTGGAFTCNLPAGSAGAIVSLADYAATWQTNNLTVSPNGSEKIGSVNADAFLTTQGQSVTFVYVDATQGWINTMDSTSNVRGNNFLVATGGTITCCGDYKTHIFTGPGTFCVSNAGNPLGSNSVEYLVVAGGGGGGYGTAYGGGGGAGGYRQNYPSPAFAGLPVTATGFPITIGAGGAFLPNSAGGTGGNSVFSTITSGGGGGGGGPGSTGVGVAGGSGGGAGASCNASPNSSITAGAGNTPPVSPPQGNPGGIATRISGVESAAGGGGGAGAAGANRCGASTAGAGGIGSPIATAFFGPTSGCYGTPGPASGRYFSGGGGSGGNNGPEPGGSGGGGNGIPAQTSGTTNTGGGGGGGGTGTLGIGGSGIVVIRYKFK
jgi:hypothetical protein